MNFFTALNRAAPYTPGMAPREDHGGHRSLTGPDAIPKPSPTPSGPLRRSRRAAPYLHPDRGACDPAARDLRALAALADLTRKLGSPLAAAQHLYAPHLRKDHK
jgi:hypothetical protein